MSKIKFPSNDIIAISICSLLFAVYPILLVFAPEVLNKLSTYLLQVFNLFLGAYISYRISIRTARNKTTELQKNTAKTAVRHLRTYGHNILSLIDNIGDKIQSSTIKKQKSDLADIINHLKSISIGISSSEADFKDILGDELIEENAKWSEITTDLQQLKSKTAEIDKLRKASERTHNDRMEQLQHEIFQLRTEITSKYHDLPIGYQGPMVDLPGVAYGPAHLALTELSNVHQITSPEIALRTSTLRISDLETAKKNEKKNKQK